MFKKYFLLFLFSIFSCFNNQSANLIKTVENVDINKFMGDWFVIASIPTFIEKNILNAVETYKLKGSNKIETTFSFHRNGLNNPKKVYNSNAVILNNKTNSEWEMKFWGPIKSKYLIISLSDDYSNTVITVPNKNYLWIMSRTPILEDSIYFKIIDNLKKLDFNIKKIKKIPQLW